MKLNKQNKKGFTIVELVIVIAVIGILSAILIPTFANLTNDAQKAARKQQASDAYTAYLLEATDGKHDAYLDRSPATAPFTYADVAIAQKSQADVAINLKGTGYWFTYDAEKGWQEKEAQPNGYTNAVVAARAANHSFVNNDEGKTEVAEGFSNLDASTFNNSVVYYK